MVGRSPAGKTPFLAVERDDKTSVASAPSHARAAALRLKCGSAKRPGSFGSTARVGGVPIPMPVSKSAERLTVLEIGGLQLALNMDLLSDHQSVGHVRQTRPR